MRRFANILEVPLPNKDERKTMIRRELKKSRCSDLDWEHILELSEGFSGSDLAKCCNDAKRKLFRRKIEAEEGQRSSRNSPKDITFEELVSSLAQIRPMNQKWKSKYEAWSKIRNNH